MNISDLAENINDSKNYDGDFTRKYATSAFRFYARCGKPNYEELKQMLYERELEKSKRALGGISVGISKPTEQAVINAERLIDEMSGKLNDILAVERTLHILAQRKNGAEIIKAIKFVYFEEPEKYLRKGDISSRVAEASIKIPLSESWIYNHLSIARDVFVTERGLRMS